MRALVTGATGFIGRRLIARLERPVVLTRDPSRVKHSLGNVEAYAWSTEGGVPPRAALAGIDTVFHLAGEPVADARWTAAKKARIMDSRRLGTRRLVDFLATFEERPKTLVSASATGYYGNRGDELLDEASAPGDDFLADVCQQWEDAARQAESLGMRVVTPRIGIVLGEAGGALAKMLPLFKLGLGGRLASGRQWMSWVHVDDVVGILLHAAAQENARGALNAVSPNPVTNGEFTKTLASAVHRPAWFPAPGFALKMAVGEFAEIVLASQRVMPRRTLESGYRFVYPQLREALEAVVHGGAHA